MKPMKHESDLLNTDRSSSEAQRLHKAFAASPIAFAYFNAVDRLLMWNAAYEDLNSHIRPLIRRGVHFSDLLADVLLQGQIDLKGQDPEDWLAERLQARRHGTTAFRNLADGRTFLVQERKDAVGGTLGIWIDVTDLFRLEALKGSCSGILGEPGDLSDHGAQDMIRSHLQVVVANLEMIKIEGETPSASTYIDDALTAATSIRKVMDRHRVPDQ